MPKITIFIPVYNGEKFIKEAIASVLDSSLRDYYIVVLDNCSKDSTLDAVKSFDDNRITCFSNKLNIGAEGNWNKCLDLVKTEYFLLLPHDDVISDDFLSTGLEIMDRYPEVGLAFGKRKIINESSNVVFKMNSRFASGIHSGRDLIRLCLASGTNLIGEPGNVIVRTSIVKDEFLFDASLPYFIDLDFWFKILSKSNAFFIPHYTSAFRISKNSWSASLSKEQFSQFKSFFIKNTASHNIHISSAFFMYTLFKAKVLSILRRFVFNYFA